MGYFRPGMSDVEGPITSPSQVPDEQIPIISPTRVSCDALPADSPWRRPGQVCAPTGSITDFFRGIFDKISAITEPSDAPVTSPPFVATTPVPSSGPSLLVLAAAGGLGYYLLTRKKRV